MADPNMALETAKLVVAAITPVLVALIAFRLNAVLQQLSQGQWANQKAVEKRIAVFDEIAPALNDLYCFFMFVGDWKELKPPDMIAAKRRIDKKLYIYEPLFPRPLIKLYNVFIHSCFQTYSGAGHDAALRTAISTQQGDRKAVMGRAWESPWNELFVSDPQEVTPRKDIRSAYFALMNAFTVALGVGLDEQEARSASNARDPAR